MNEVPFHQTRMGVTFYEVHVPKLIDVLGRLTEAVEQLVDRKSKQGDQDREAEDDRG